ncbi:hypothetical protein H0I23_09230 [Cellulophaga sp. HaHaR_3_176]|uniref:hypothetical protein n=1 Tax=Cellulophaga sp. HaHaR_3_176 TaxID=1942464 RepID=UPI001C1FFE13|nr:hypothetical protein [Cellulophaga sp. HaHaR_3_176]QWX82650.1 hypothetical protein H0I23_09230 [Cellulophaga sp. HaHaR_3_176]
MNYVIIFITAILGAYLTFFTSERLKQGPVRSSAALSLIVGLFFYYLPELCSAYLTKNIPIVFIGASFIGMISPQAKGNYIRLTIAASLFSIIYLNKGDFFEGYGGALGALAFIALLSAMGFSVIISRSSRLKKGIVKLRNKTLKQRK